MLKYKNTYFPEHLAMVASDRSSNNQDQKHLFYFNFISKNNFLPFYNIIHWKLQNVSYIQKRMIRSSPSELFLGKGVLKIGSKVTGEHPRRSAISISFKAFALWHGCSLVNLLHILEHLFLRTHLEGCFWMNNTFKRQIWCNFEYIFL